MIERRELIKAAAADGVTLTRNRLIFWQREGLIERAEKRYGEGRGARGYYTDDTLERVKIINHALSQQRDFDFARLALWRAGFSIDVRSIFLKGVDLVEQFHRRIAQDWENLDNNRYTTLYEEPLNLDSQTPLTKRLVSAGVHPESLTYFVDMLHDPDNAGDIGKTEAVQNDERKIDQHIMQAMAGLIGMADHTDPYELIANLKGIFNPEQMRLRLEGDLSHLRDVDAKLRQLFIPINLVMLTVCGVSVDIENRTPEQQTVIILAFASILDLSIKTDDGTYKRASVLVDRLLGLFESVLTRNTNPSPIAVDC